MIQNTMYGRRPVAEMASAMYGSRLNAQMMIMPRTKRSAIEVFSIVYEGKQFTSPDDKADVELENRLLENYADKVSHNYRSGYNTIRISASKKQRTFHWRFAARSRLWIPAMRRSGARQCSCASSPRKSSRKNGCFPSTGTAMPKCRSSIAMATKSSRATITRTATSSSSTNRTTRLMQQAWKSWGNA